MEEKLVRNPKQELRLRKAFPRNLCSLVIRMTRRTIQDMFTANEDFPDLREVLNENNVPIYRQRIMKTMPVYGMWWMDESQWVRFLWRGHSGYVVKSGQDPDRVLTTRKFEVGSCYVRVFDDHVDIEALSRTTKWNPNGGRKVKKNRTVREWLTVSVSLDEYENLVDNYLGPVQDVCHCKDKPSKTGRPNLKQDD